MNRRAAKGRAVNGILLLDKPVGMGSNELLQVVKRLSQARKAGHTGSLDRLASGLLPLCFGEATKISGFLLNADKHYLAGIRLGVTTSTADAEGKVLRERPLPSLTRERVEEVLARFTGEIKQIPPMHSAIKHHGQRLYKLAHQGLVVEREPRTVTIHAFHLLGMTPDCLDVEVRCTKGTYIRTLAEDVGEALGCGAHVGALRRTAVGPFTADEMISLAALRSLADEGPQRVDDALLPMDAALANWPPVSVPENAAFYLRRGQPVLVPHAPTEGLVRIYAGSRRFLGVGEVLEDGRIAPKRLIHTA